MFLLSEPFKTYSFRVSALTVKGESEQSKEVNAVTDHRGWLVGKF